VVRIAPPHRCPPNVLAAALAVVPELRTILEAEGGDLLGAGGDGDAMPLDLPAGRALAAEPPGIAACAPTKEQVEALAAAMLAQADACPATTLPDREAALRIFRSQARGRLASTNDPMARGLLLGFERHQAAMAVHAKGTGR
jgi:hypothetical protein